MRFVCCAPRPSPTRDVSRGRFRNTIHEFVALLAVCHAAYVDHLFRLNEANQPGFILVKIYRYLVLYYACSTHVTRSNVQ